MGKKGQVSANFNGALRCCNSNKTCLFNGNCNYPITEQHKPMIIQIMSIPVV